MEALPTRKNRTQKRAVRLREKALPHSQPVLSTALRCQLTPLQPPSNRVPARPKVASVSRKHLKTNNKSTPRLVGSQKKRRKFQLKNCPTQKCKSSVSLALTRIPVDLLRNQRPRFKKTSRRFLRSMEVSTLNPKTCLRRLSRQ